MAGLSIFQKIKLINRISKAVKEIKKIIELNKDNVQGAKEIVEEAKALLEKIKNFAPVLAKQIEDIITIIKKVFKK